MCSCLHLRDANIMLSSVLIVLTVAHLLPATTSAAGQAVHQHCYMPSFIGSSEQQSETGVGQVQASIIAHRLPNKLDCRHRMHTGGAPG